MSSPRAHIGFRVHVDTGGLIEEGQGLAAGDTAQPAPPVVAYWEYWAGDKAQWRRLAVTSDLTAAFTRTGDVTFDAPTDFVARKVGLKQRDTDPALFWLRYRIDSVLGNGYETTPLLEDVLLNTVTATNAVTETDELVGAADGTPSQSYTLQNIPVLPDTLVLQVDEGQGYVTWTRVADFGGSTRTDTHYTLDPATGMIQFGDGEHGKIALPYPITSQPGISQDLTDPRPVANIKALVYRWGGGAGQFGGRHDQLAAIDGALRRQRDEPAALGGRGRPGDRRPGPRASPWRDSQRFACRHGQRF